MSGLNHKSQINMAVPPTEDNHVMRKQDMVEFKQGGVNTDISQFPDFSFFVRCGEQYIPIEIDVTARIGSGNMITSDAVAKIGHTLSGDIALINETLGDRLTALANELIRGYFTKCQVQSLFNQIIDLKRGGLNSDASGYPEFSLLVKMNGRYTPVDIDIIPRTGSGNLITSDALAAVSGQITEILNRLKAAGI